MSILPLLESGVLYALTGAFAGLMAGVLGIGGGIVVVPALVFVFHLMGDVPVSIEMHVAAGSSLAIMIVTAIASVRAHRQQGTIRMDVFQRMWPFIVIGTVVGVLLADLLPTRALEIIFGVFLLLILLNMLHNINIEYAKRYPTPWIHRLVCSVIGFKSGLLGIGGGALIIPYLNYCGVETKKIPAVSAMCTLVVSVIGTLSVMIIGHFSHAGLHYATGYVYWPAVISVAVFSALIAPFGARITYLLPVKQLKYAFIAVLFFAAINLLV